MPWGNGPFQVFERINGNVYKIDLLSEYPVYNTFDVYCHSLFYMLEDDHYLNLRSNFSQYVEDDAIQISSKPLIWSQAWELKRIQGLIMKEEVLEEVLSTLERYHLRMISLTLG